LESSRPTQPLRPSPARRPARRRHTQLFNYDVAGRCCYGLSSNHRIVSNGSTPHAGIEHRRAGGRAVITGVGIPLARPFRPSAPISRCRRKPPPTAHSQPNHIQRHRQRHFAHFFNIAHFEQRSTIITQVSSAPVCRHSRIGIVAQPALTQPASHRSDHHGGRRQHGHDVAARHASSVVTPTGTVTRQQHNHECHKLNGVITGQVITDRQSHSQASPLRQRLPHEGVGHHLVHSHYHLRQPRPHECIEPHRLAIGQVLTGAASLPTQPSLRSAAPQSRCRQTPPPPSHGRDITSSTSLRSDSPQLTSLIHRHYHLRQPTLTGITSVTGWRPAGPHRNRHPCQHSHRVDYWQRFALLNHDGASTGTAVNANYTITTAEPIVSTGPIPLNTTINAISGTTITMSRKPT